MIVLHLVLVLSQMKTANGTLPPAGQWLFDRFCQDMDDNLREMGVGDFAVPKRMQKVGEAFYGRAKVYEGALADDNPVALPAAVARNVFGAAEPPSARGVSLPICRTWRRVFRNWTPMR